MKYEVDFLKSRLNECSISYKIKMLNCLQDGSLEKESFLVVRSLYPIRGRNSVISNDVMREHPLLFLGKTPKRDISDIFR